MRTYSILVLVVALVLQESFGAKKGYYWLDYNATIPKDALIGGYDGKGKEVYIGLAQVEQVGNIPGPIYANKFSMEVPTIHNQGSLTVNSYIKILCGDNRPVDWIRASGDNLQVVLIGEKPVTGGDFKDRGYVHIGRVSYQNEIKIGPVLSFDLNIAELWFVHNGTVLNTHSYEVLLYDSPMEHHCKPGPHCHHGPPPHKRH